MRGFAFLLTEYRDIPGSCASTMHPESVQTVIDSYVHGGSLPCAQYMILHKAKEVFYGASGFADAKKTHTIERDTIFRIYSMTKPVTVIAAMIFIERGLMSLSDPVKKFIPSFGSMKVLIGGTAVEPVLKPADRDITIQDLMTHTSGITYGFFGNTVCDQILRANTGDDWRHWFHHTPLAKLCEYIAATPLLFEPGSQWHYGLSTDVLGHVLERVSNTTLDVILKREIFSPLEMIDTGFMVSPENAYRFVDCFEFNQRHGFVPSLEVERDRLSEPVLLGGGGGLVSTIHDFSLLVQCLMNNGYMEKRGKQLLSPASIQAMCVNYLPNNADITDVSHDNGFSEAIGEGIGFGLGAAVVTDPQKARGSALSGEGEYAWGGVASTYFSIDFEKQVALIFMTQVIPSSACPYRPHLRWLAHKYCSELAAEELRQQEELNA